MLPPDRLITWEYIRDIIAGRKKLLRTEDIVSEYVPPKLKEYSTADIWERIQADPRLVSYFPPCRGKVPPKRYLFQILNTVTPDFVNQLLRTINRLREEERPPEDEIRMTDEMIEFLEGKEGSKFGKAKNTLKLLSQGRR